MEPPPAPPPVAGRHQSDGAALDQDDGEWEQLRSSSGGVEEPADAWEAERGAGGAAHWDASVATLVEMGFEEGLARGTLAVCEGNVEAALVMLADGEGVAAVRAYHGPLPELPRPEQQMTVVQLYGQYSSRCGYCKDPQGFCAFAFRTRRTNPFDFEALTMRSFTRSGTWTYQPVGERSCCALYQIRLDPARWVPSPAHRKAERRVARFFAPAPAAVPPVQRLSAAEEAASDALLHALSTALSEAVTRARHVLPPLDHVPPTLHVRRPKNTTTLYRTPVAALLHALWPSAAHVRPTLAQLAAAIVEHWPDAAHAASFDEASAVICFGNTNNDAIRQHAAQRQPKRHKHQHVDALSVTLEEAEYSDEKWELYRAYQRAIHNDEDARPDSFRKFVCDSPIARLPPRDDGDLPFGLGTAHMVYRDTRSGRLLGVACLDILPTCLVSVYFFFDPLIRASCPLGTYSACREIELARTARNIRHYMLCWYSPNAPKLDYKRRFEPSELMCPQTLTWYAYDKVRPLLDEFGYTRLAPPDVPGPPAVADDVIFTDLFCEFQGLTMPYARARDFTGEEWDAKMLELAQRLGPELCRAVIVVLPLGRHY